MRPSTLPVLLAPVLGLIACSSGPIIQTCQATVDCGPGQVCLQGQCRGGSVTTGGGAASDAGAGGGSAGGVNGGGAA
ncbi:MAG: hypothetical protein INH37_03065, partial [Myxococcaceae bacterium]|nr:hypothetical protein [Myxococcaceae bacterium]